MPVNSLANICSSFWNAVLTKSKCGSNNKVVGFKKCTSSLMCKLLYVTNDQEIAVKQVIFWLAQVKKS